LEPQAEKKQTIRLHRIKFFRIKAKDSKVLGGCAADKKRGEFPLFGTAFELKAP